MGGASANHAPAVTPIITEGSNPVSDRARHLPSPPLQAQATITREDHPSLWAEQAPTMLYQSSLKTRTFCPTMQSSCVLATDTTISPLLQSQAQECKYHPYPLKTRTFRQAVQSSPYLTKPRISPPPHPPSFPITSTVECNSHPYPLNVVEDVCKRVIIYQLQSSICS